MAPIEEFGRLVAAALPAVVEQMAVERPGAIHDAVMRVVEQAVLALVLARTGGNQLRAARELGLNRNTLRKRCRELGLPVPGPGRRPPVSTTATR